MTTRPTGGASTPGSAATPSMRACSSPSRTAGSPRYGPDAAPGAASNRLYGLVIPGYGQCAFACVPPGAAGAHTTRPGIVLDMARSDVPRGGPARSRTGTGSWPGRSTPRWRWRASPSVGEFHYLHHDAGGRRYSDPNAMGHALIEAAADAGSAADPAGHVLSQFGARRDAAEGRATTALRRRQRSGLGRACRGAASAGTHQPGRDRRCGIAFGARRAGRAHARGGRMGRRPRDARCTCTRRSSGPKSSSASPRTGVRPQPSSRTRACSDRGPPPCTPRI